MDPRGMDKYSPPLYAHVLRNDGSRQVIRETFHEPRFVLIPFHNIMSSVPLSWI